MWKDGYTDGCPECGSTDVTGGPVEAEGGQAWQDCGCRECGAEWRDVYGWAFREPCD